ncbi:MAG: tetratricopeptide repeat protein [Candidatus Pacebacteria bacterium]|nr:tetratricopeptide repeat protein [Candidatus Paceibacterota bacterium]MCF7857669.1 tetratricopeptide repeat protein [Candidatus Paceibacterota bacterium]
MSFTSDDESRQQDPVAVSLRNYAQNILVVIFGLLPLAFVPTLAAPFDYSKALFVVVGLFIALVLYSLSVLRSGVVAMAPSYVLVAMWAVVGIAFISSLLSGDFKDSLVGDLFSIHSTIFVAILALIPSVWVFLKVGKTAIMRMYILLTVSTLILVLFHISRLFFGIDFLSFGVFASNVATPVGSWNDLALFLGLTVILSLVTLEQLSLTKIGRTLFAVVILTALVMLCVINFFTVWLVLGLTSLAMIVYTLGKDRFSGNQLSLTNTQTPNVTSLSVSLVVFVVSVVFVIGGSMVGGWVTKYTNITYVEVRPSVQATADIARNVYHENAFLGIGTNKFTDAWRLYKDDSINYTPFWNTDFNAGNGYVTSFFVTTGVLGGMAWVVFLLTFLIVGTRKLLSATDSDKMWYFIGVSSFVSALYIWGMSVIYVPGVVILLLGALCTGVSLGAFNVLTKQRENVVSVGANRRTGFVLTLVVIMIIIGSVSILYVSGRHYSSVYAFNQSVISMQEGKSFDELEKKVSEAFQLSGSDVFARRIAEYQLARMNNLVSLTEPTEDQQRQFQSASVNGVNAAQQAIQIDGLEPANWSVLGGIYSILASVNIEGAQDRAVEALVKSQELNPKNPLPYLESAIVVARGGDFDSARAYIEKAIALKPNYTEAFFLLSQLEIAEGNVEAAIASTQAVINLEPQNPARYYQLGVLESSRKNLKGSIQAFEKAISLDQNYANARYLLALSYDEAGRSDDSKRQLEAVLNLNPGNTEITELIKVIGEEGSLERLRTAANRTVSETAPAINENGTVSTTQESGTSLVTPVNTAPSITTVAPE